MQARSVGLTAASLARLLALNPSEVPLVIGSTLITGGMDTRVLFDDGDKLGESAGFTYTKASGLLASTALAINGAAIGTNALAVGGPTSLNPGGNNPILVGRNSDNNNYSIISFGTLLTDAGFIGVQARGSTDLSLFLQAGAAATTFVRSGGINIAALTPGGISINAAGVFGFNATTIGSGSTDTGISRLGPASFGFGNGTQGNISAAITATAATFSGALTSAAAVADSGYNYQTPSTGFSITMANTNYHLILDPAGTLATGTITMCAAPVDGQVVDIKISQIITALTVAGNSGQSVKGNPTSAAVGSSFTGIYRATNTTWYF